MKKNTEISERLVQVIDYLGLSKNDFANNLGYNRSQAIYDMTSGKAKPSFSFFSKFANSEYSEQISLDWLITGKEEMVKRKVQKTLPIEKVRKRVRKSDKTKSTKNITLSEGVPLIPVDAMAGFGGGEVQVMDYEAERYIVPEFEEMKVDFMIRVKGSSMYPKYNSGDLIACRKLVLNDIFFQWNKVYVLDTEQGPLVKRIKKGPDKNHILIVSDNDSYQPFELSLSKVNSIAIVIGVIRLE